MGRLLSAHSNARPSAVKAYDDYICTIPTRTVGYDDALRLAAIRNVTVEDTRRWLDHHTELAEPSNGNRPIENGMIAEILFNVRFLWYIYGTCGERKRGWIIMCHRHINEIVRRSEVKDDVTTMPTM